ncbi:MAG: patatin-like phospholipase family protein [Gammaproteobacteria bacterium]|nr:patatin-like phospholipase family protein [Gammaproteobacteria bacterium]
MKKNNEPVTALILSGGGARAAYQVGVLQGLADIFPKHSPNPFPILCGTSAGAINAAAMAIYAAQFREAVWRLVHVWANFHVDQVFRAGFGGLSLSALRWLGTLTGGIGGNQPVSLLDRTPLAHLLSQYMPFEQISQTIKDGHVRALCLTASSYSGGETVSFFQGDESIEPWVRSRRVGVRDTIGIEHLLASSAIPFVFAPQRIGDEYFGDGSMRQTAPLSPAMHLGADRLVVIGVRHIDTAPVVARRHKEPSLGEVAGHVLDSIFLDTLDVDVERVQRNNRFIEQIPNKHLPEDSATLRPVDVLFISPSQDLYKIAEKHAQLMPLSVRFFLRALGVKNERGSNLLSYLLFEKAYCRDLIALGYADTLARRKEICEFFGLCEEHGKKVDKFY